MTSYDCRSLRARPKGYASRRETLVGNLAIGEAYVAKVVTATSPDATQRTRYGLVLPLALPIFQEGAGGSTSTPAVTISAYGRRWVPRSPGRDPGELAQCPWPG